MIEEGREGTGRGHPTFMDPRYAPVYIYDTPWTHLTTCSLGVRDVRLLC